MFAQIDPVTTATAASTASSLLSDRSDAMVILVGVLGIVALWIWKIQIPAKQSEQKLREADKEIHHQNAATLAELSKVTTGIHDKTVHTHKNLTAMMEVKDIELDCLSKLADYTKCNIQSELSEAKGVIRSIRAGATSET